jgi:hypothetical protein
MFIFSIDFWRAMKYIVYILNVFKWSWKMIQPTTSTLKGAELGARTGLKLGFGYSLTIVLLFSIVWGASTGIVGFILMLGISSVVGWVIGVLPSMFLGAVTGWLVENVLARRAMDSSTQAAQVGWFISSLLALCINGTALLVAQPSFSSDVAGWLIVHNIFVGLPSLIYIVTAGRMSVHLYVERGNASAVNLSKVTAH